MQISMLKVHKDSPQMFGKIQLLIDSCPYSYQECLTTP